MMREPGDMIGTEVSLADMDKKAEERSGLLQVKVFLEKLQLSLKWAIECSLLEGENSL